MTFSLYICTQLLCQNLTTAPELPATTLTELCYSGMFADCSALTAASELPATTLAKDCYAGMFYDCENLTTAPVLPATTLVKGCYSNMFYHCNKLNSVTCLATYITAPICTYQWLDGVAATGTLTVPSTMTTVWPTGSGDGVPTGWGTAAYVEP